MQTTNLTFRFITFNAHPNNPSFLINFLDILLPKVRSTLTHFVIGKEKVGTPGEHVHLLLGKESFGNPSHYKQFILFKEMQDFMQAIKGSQTIWDTAYDEKKLLNTPESMLKNIGYILKECEPENQEIRGFKKDYIEDCIQFYLAHGRIKNELPSHLRDWKVLSKKNAHNQIMDFMHKNNVTIRDPLLVFKMRESCYSFCDLTSKAQKEILDDILISSKNMDENERQKCITETLDKTYDGQYCIEQSKVDIVSDMDLKEKVYTLEKANERLEEECKQRFTDFLKMRSELETKIKKLEKDNAKLLATTKEQFASAVASFTDS